MGYTDKGPEAPGSSSKEGLNMKRMLCFLLALLVLPWGGCAAAPEEATLVASFYPVYVLAENVLEGVPGVNLICMTAPATGCLHDYQLLTSDMRALSGATALLINGAGMEGFLPDIQKQLPGLPVIDCSQGVELLADEEEHEGHDHGAVNAHIWLDPENAVQMVENMAAGLSALLPASADQIARNAQAYIARLRAVDEELSQALATLPRREIVTFHEAFPYFARAYDLQVVAVIALEPDEPISPKMLSQVVKQVKAAGNPPLFTEPQYESAALRAVSQETGAPVYALDPLVTGEAALTAYEDAMRQNLAVLLTALGD